MQKESISDGPAPLRTASPAAAVPTVAKMPAPIIAPIPSKVMLKAPNVRLSDWVCSPRDARMSSRLLVRKIPRSNVIASGVEFGRSYVVVTIDLKGKHAEFGMDGRKRGRGKNRRQQQGAGAGQNSGRRKR